MLKILDCTLRDGGYYTNWDFSADVVDAYIDAMNQLPIDYLEVGYRNNPSGRISRQVWLLTNLSPQAHKKKSVARRL